MVSLGMHDPYSLDPPLFLREGGVNFNYLPQRRGSESCLDQSTIERLLLIHG